METEFLEVERVLVNAVSAMFMADGKEVVHRGITSADSRVGGHVVIANIGFAATGARGSVVLVASREATRALHAALDFDSPDAKARGDIALCDMLGEWSNMILGRFKNQLSKRGAVLTLGTPMAAIAFDLKLASPGPFFSWHTFDVDGWLVYARLDATLTESFVLGPEVTTAAAFAEGDIMLF